jgi:hypothetical protein
MRRALPAPPVYASHRGRWQAKIDSVARAPLHQTAADDALQPRPPTGNAAAPRSARDLLPSIKWGSEVNSRTENVAHGYQGEGPHNELLRQEAAALSVSHQLRQLGDVGGDAAGLVAGERLGRCMPSALARARIYTRRIANPAALEPNDANPCEHTPFWC